LAVVVAGAAAAVRRIRLAGVQTMCVEFARLFGGATSGTALNLHEFTIVLAPISIPAAQVSPASQHAIRSEIPAIDTVVFDYAGGSIASDCAPQACRIRRSCQNRLRDLYNLVRHSRFGLPDSQSRRLTNCNGSRVADISAPTAILIIAP